MTAPPGIDQVLLAISWRGINFPIADLDTSFSQNISEHKFPDRDAAYIESLGRGSIRVKCKALFHNDLSPGKIESWEYGKLFPNQFNLFLDACKDRTLGRLVHPFLGGFDAKVLSFNAKVEANQRGGATVDVEWAETIQPDLSANVSSDFHLDNTAQQFTDALNEVKSRKFPPNLPKDTPDDFFDSIQKIKGKIGKFSLAVQHAIGMIDRLQYQINSVITALEAANDVTFSYAIRKANETKAGLRKLAQNINGLAGTTRTFITPKEMTVGELTQRLHANVSDLISLNPWIVREATIPQWSAIKHKAVDKGFGI